MRRPCEIAEPAPIDIRALTQAGRLTSDWQLVDQTRIDRFAEATGDRQFIHVDPILAARSPFGGTVAHGLLTLSLIPAFAYATLPAIAAERMSVNYGYDRIRFLSPVRSGTRVRAHFDIIDVGPRGAGCWQVTMDVTIEIEGEPKPALLARSISLTYTD